MKDYRNETGPSPEMRAIEEKDSAMSLRAALEMCAFELISLAPRLSQP